MRTRLRCLAVFGLLAGCPASTGRAPEPTTPDSRLREAAARGDLELTRSLLRQGADPDRLDRRKENALVKAVRGKNAAVVKLLLDAGASPNPKLGLYNPLMCVAVINGTSEIIALLIAARTYLDVSCGRQTALGLAIKYDKLDIARQLLAGDASPTFHTGDMISPLAQLRGKSLTVATPFLVSIADLLRRRWDWLLPGIGDGQVLFDHYMRLVSKYQVPTEAEGKKIVEALGAAAWRRASLMRYEPLYPVNALIAHGLDPDAPIDGRSPIELACRHHMPDAALVLAWHARDIETPRRALIAELRGLVNNPDATQKALYADPFLGPKLSLPYDQATGDIDLDYQLPEELNTHAPMFFAISRLVCIDLLGRLVKRPGWRPMRDLLEDLRLREVL